MRCHGVKRYALRCKNSARPGKVTCSIHDGDEAWAREAFEDRIAVEQGLASWIWDAPQAKAS
jgi:hypothetical protein